MKEFIDLLRKRADICDRVGDKQGVRTSMSWYGKAEESRKNADELEEKFLSDNHNG